MKALVYLYLLRMKGNIRNIFMRPGTAIFACIMILIYGGMFVMLLMNPGATLSMLNITAINGAIFIGLAFTAFMIAVMLMQSRKSLFMENDAFYLFSGPFKRSHAMQFVMSQSLVSALMCGLVSLFMMVALGNYVKYSGLFLLLTFLSHFLVYFFFTILYYYVYLLSIKDKKYRHVSIYVMLFFAFIIITIFIIVLAQNDFVLKDAGMRFLDSNLFYAVPLFGWVKLILVSFVANDMLMVLLGASLLLLACGIIYYAMCNYKGEFVEKAMQDAIEYTKRYKELKAGGRSSMKDAKVREVKSSFKEGAKAITSKNMLIMKKTHSFITMQDVVFITIYLFVAVLGDFGFSFFVYMMIFWLFITIQNADFMKEMNNYQIYLIPEPPFTKLWGLLYPYITKYMVIAFAPILIGAIIMKVSMLDALQNYVMLAGYACLFVSASVLATRLLKSRNNAIMENMLRMLITLVAALPSVIVMIVVINLGFFEMYIFVWISVLSLLMNFVISALILYGCRNMMNGREIKSE